MLMEAIPFKKQESQPIIIPQLSSRFSDRQKRRRSFLKLSKDISSSTFSQLNSAFIVNPSNFVFQHHQSQNDIQHAQKNHQIKQRTEGVYTTFSTFEFSERKEFKEGLKQPQKQELKTQCSTKTIKNLSKQTSAQIQRKQFMFQKLEEIDQRNNFLSHGNYLTHSLRILARQNQMHVNQDVTHDLYSRSYQTRQDNFFQLNSLSSQEFEKLPHGAHHGQTKSCQICMEQVIEDEQQTFLYCSHSFHSECIQVWLRDHATCPLCKMNIRKQLSRSLKLIHATSLK